MNPSVVRADDPAELFSLIPYLLGFHPEQSLVVLAIDDNRVVFTARLDLVADDMVEAARVGGIALGQGADHLVVVAYSDDPLGASDLVDVFTRLVPAVLPVDAVWLVHEERYWCLRPGCGCATGEAFDPTTSTAAAIAVLAGLRVSGSRDELRALIQQPTGELGDEVARAYDRVEGPAVADGSDEERRDRLALLLDEWLARPRVLEPVECAELSMLVRDPRVRDIATLRIDRRDAEDHVDLWTQVARSSAAPFDVPAVCLAGLAAWVAGDGALLNVCIERAEQLEPGFSLLRILTDISDAGVPPQEWDALCAELRAVA